MEGVDSIVALAKRKPVSPSQADKRLGDNDSLISLPKFTSQVAKKRYPQDRWESLPELLAYSQNHRRFKCVSVRYLLTELLEKMAKCTLFHRPHRVEPRVVKRRPKPFKLMMKPRTKLREELIAGMA